MGPNCCWPPTSPSSSTVNWPISASFCCSCWLVTQVLATRWRPGASKEPRAYSASCSERQETDDIGAPARAPAGYLGTGEAPPQPVGDGLPADDREPRVRAGAAGFVQVPDRRRAGQAALSASDAAGGSRSGRHHDSSRYQLYADTTA